MGAPKPDEIAPATPHPMNISAVIGVMNFSLSHEPIVAPKCTIGPYCPTEAPPAAEKNAAKVLSKPALTFSSLSSRCAAYILSAGPSNFLRFPYF